MERKTAPGYFKAKAHHNAMKPPNIAAPLVEMSLRRLVLFAC